LIYLRTEIIILAMSWNSDRIKGLRKRLGWTQSEMARKLACDCEFIREWEASEDEYITDTVLSFIEVHSDELVLLEKQADVHSDQIIDSALAESFLEEASESQVHTSTIRRIFEKN
jgi:transcriptional regulator with XRE-family HTH domain